MNKAVKEIPEGEVAVGEKAKAPEMKKPEPVKELSKSTTPQFAPKHHTLAKKPEIKAGKPTELPAKKEEKKVEGEKHESAKDIAKGFAKEVAKDAPSHSKSTNQLKELQKIVKDFERKETKALDARKEGKKGEAPKEISAKKLVPEGFFPQIKK